MGAPPWTVAYFLTSPTARERLVAALSLERLRGQPVPDDELVGYWRGISPHMAAFVYDLSPWNESAVGRLRRLRRDYPDLPVLLYAPIRPGIGRLIMASAEFPGVFAELQLDGPDEAYRLSHVLREVLGEYRQVQVLRRVDRIIERLPGEVSRFCRTALRVLQAADPGNRFSVQLVANAMGVSRRYVERIFKGKRMMRPRELLDWTILISTAALAVDRGIGLFTAGSAFGIEPARVRRARKRLRWHGLDCDIENPRGGEFDNVMAALWTRCAELRLGGSSLQFITTRPLKLESLRTPSPTPRAPATSGRRWTVVFPKP